MLGLNRLEGNPLRRANVLASMVSGILFQHSSSIAALARFETNDQAQPTREKKLTRWLQSEYNSYKVHFMPYIITLLCALGKAGSLTFSIDGSTAGRGCMVLMFSVIYKNRAIPVIWHVAKAKKGHLPESMHIDLIKRLAEVVPKDCEITIIGDGEYDGCDWQKTITKQGWHYVLRTGIGRLVELEEGEQIKLGWFTPTATEEFFWIEGVRFTRKRYGPVNVLVWHEKGYKDPLYLLTDYQCPYQIASFYKQRFKIETFFSDQKSRGFNIHRSKLSHPERLEKLLIATCLAYILCILGGIKCLQSKFYKNIHRRDRCNLSLFSLGLRFIELLVDKRQWRAFSLAIKPPEKQYFYHTLAKT